jgi:hypothetical protein
VIVAANRSTTPTRPGSRPSHPGSASGIRRRSPARRGTAARPLDLIVERLPAAAGAPDEATRWLPADHLAWFVLEGVDGIDLSDFDGDYLLALDRTRLRATGFAPARQPQPIPTAA